MAAGVVASRLGQKGVKERDRRKRSKGVRGGTGQDGRKGKKISVKRLQVTEGHQRAAWDAWGCKTDTETTTGNWPDKGSIPHWRTKKGNVY